MRIYELAKKMGVTSRELLDKFSKGGHNFSSHMSVVTKEAEDFINKTKSDGSSVQKIKVGNSVASEIKKTKSNVVAGIKKNTDLAKPSSESEKKTPFQSRFVSRARSNGFSSKKLTDAVTKVCIEKDMPLFEVAKMFGRTDGDLIFLLLGKGIALNRNNVLSVDTIKMLADSFGLEVEIGSGDKTEKFHKGFDISKDAVIRWPIVVIMGHVDHGKTTLLDYIRKINTAEKEKGGITQHIGAYEVDSAHGKIVFLDTPGHESFSYLRKKGAKITDIAILIVAADDGVMPQTIDALKNAKDAKIPIIVAINKVDKPGISAGIETVKRQLAEHDLVPEDWGGNTICVPISAKTGEGVNELLEMIILQSQMMELKANPDLPAKAFILESKIEKGFGPVATVICTEGSLKQDDFFVCGNGGTGRVRLLVNSHGKKIKKAEPSIPVKVVGFDDFSLIGEWLEVVDRKEYLRVKSGRGSYRPTVHANLPQQIASGFEENLNIIIKTDALGSKEAIIDSLGKISKQKKDAHCPVRIVSGKVGAISEGDVLFAENTGSIIFGLHVKVERNAVKLAREKGVEIKLYDVIYHLVEDIEKILISRKKVVIKWVKTGEAEVRKVFNIKKVGVIAGCYVRDGVFSRGDKVECIRSKVVVGEGRIVTLQRDKKVIKEVPAGYECGFTCDGFQGWKEGDTVISYHKEK